MIQHFLSRQAALNEPQQPYAHYIKLHTLIHWQETPLKDKDGNRDGDGKH